MSISAPSSAAPTVIKLGGALLESAEILLPLWQALPAMQRRGPVVLVHGGGPQATEMARRLGHEPRIVHGRRVTTDLDLSIIQWTIRGALNTGLVAQAAAHGVRAVGLSGADGPTVLARRRPPWDIDGEQVDFGWVGDVQRVDPALPQALLAAGFAPIIAPLATDGAGNVYNVNADTVALEIAAALGAGSLLLLAEAGGVRRDVADAASIVGRLTPAEQERGLAEGWIAGGMRVKVAVATRALAAGIPDVRILAPADLGTLDHGTRVLR